MQVITPSVEVPTFISNNEYRGLNYTTVEYSNKMSQLAVTSKVSSSFAVVPKVLLAVTWTFTYQSTKVKKFKLHHSASKYFLKWQSYLRNIFSSSYYALAGIFTRSSQVDTAIILLINISKHTHNLIQPNTLGGNNSFYNSLHVNFIASGCGFTNTCIVAQCSMLYV